MNSSSSILEHRSRRFPRAYGVLIASFVVVGVTVVASLVRPIGPTATETQDRDPAAPTRLAPLTGPGAAIPAVGSIAQIDHSIRAWTTNLAANPKDFISATNLATLYHARGRLTGNLDDQARALEAARTAAAIAPNQTAASSLEATILYTLHDFGASLAVADRLYRANPADLGALATRADTELELGQMAAARADYDTLAARASGPAIDIRLARLAYLSGDAARSLTLAITARDAAAADPGTDLGFYHYAVGEYARLTGDGDLARRSYTAAIALRPADFGSLLGLGKVQASTGDLAGAIATLEQAAAIVPQPETLTLLGDLHALMGDATGAADAYATVGAIRTLSSIEGLVFDRQLLLFDLDHGAATSASLAAAEDGLATRTDAAGYDLAAWAAYRLGRFELSTSYITSALATGVQDARILEHAGAIAIATGDGALGAQRLRAALALGPALDPLATVEAHRLLEGRN